MNSYFLYRYGFNFSQYRLKRKSKNLAGWTLNNFSQKYPIFCKIKVPKFKEKLHFNKKKKIHIHCNLSYTFVPISEQISHAGKMGLICWRRT